MMAVSWPQRRTRYGEDYEVMRWLESGGGGGGSKMPLVQKLLMALLSPAAADPMVGCRGVS